MSGVLAPALGRLAGPSRDRPFDEVRLALVDSLVSTRATGPLGGAGWLAAWHAAAESICDMLLAEAHTAIDRAAQRSRFPEARLATLKPDAASRETLLNRLLAEGEGLERLDGPASDEAITRARGAMLESAWDAAMRIANSERGHWLGVANDVERWRRPWRPLVISATLAIVVVATLAAMLGGVLPAPGWFTPVIEWFWSLPWP